MTLFEGHPLLVWRRQWHPTPVLLPGESHGWRSLVGCSPWGRQSLTQLKRFSSSSSIIGIAHSMQFPKVGNRIRKQQMSLCMNSKCIFPVAQMVKNLPAMQETQVRSLGQEDPLEKEMATHSSILPWRIPMDAGGLQSMGSQR